MPVTSERTFVVQVPESQAKQLDTIWDKFRSYYECFVLVSELKKHYELAKANSAHLEDGHSSDDKEFVQKVDSVLNTLGDKGIDYPASSVLKHSLRRVNQNASTQTTLTLATMSVTLLTHS